MIEKQLSLFDNQQLKLIDDNTDWMSFTINDLLAFLHNQYPTMDFKLTEPDNWYPTIILSRNKLHFKVYMTCDSTADISDIWGNPKLIHLSLGDNRQGMAEAVNNFNDLYEAVIRYLKKFKEGF